MSFQRSREIAALDSVSALERHVRRDPDLVRSVEMHQAGENAHSPRTHAEALALASSSILFAGIVLLAILPRVAGCVLIVGVVTRIGAHLITGIVSYRAAMSRPWPTVAPVVDDDW